MGDSKVERYGRAIWHQHPVRIEAQNTYENCLGRRRRNALNVAKGLNMAKAKEEDLELYVPNTVEASMDNAFQSISVLNNMLQGCNIVFYKTMSTI
jgi:hypothetical protein